MMTTAEPQPAAGQGFRGVQAWPTMFFLRPWDRHTALRGDIITCLRELQVKQSKPVASGVAESMKSARGLHEGGFDLLREPHPALRPLARFIEETVAAAASIANDREVSPEDLVVTIVDSWYHITNDSGFHDAHYHHGCSWCGIYYVQVGESGRKPGGGAPNGSSRFYCPFLSGGQYVDYGNRYLKGSLDMPIEDGQLLLFPSYLLHSGLPYRGGEDRIVIAFNSQVHIRAGTAAAARFGDKNT
jgi:uncharacterized protein (TIGR02466 family)